MGYIHFSIFCYLSMLFNGKFVFCHFPMLFNGKFAFWHFPMLFNENLRIKKFGGDVRTDVRTDIRKFTPVSYRTSALWGRCLKRRKIKNYTNYLQTLIFPVSLFYLKNVYNLKKISARFAFLSLFDTMKEVCQILESPYFFIGL